MVVIFFPEASAAEVRHERAGRPSRRTVHAPHCPSPQPYFVPVSSRLSRNTESRDSPASASADRFVPFTRRTRAAIRPPTKRGLLGAAGNELYSLCSPFLLLTERTENRKVPVDPTRTFLTIAQSHSSFGRVFIKGTL